jgi:hypothetical protein
MDRAQLWWCSSPRLFAGVVCSGSPSSSRQSRGTRRTCTLALWPLLFLPMWCCCGWWNLRERSKRLMPMMPAAPFAVCRCGAGVAGCTRRSPGARCRRLSLPMLFARLLNPRRSSLESRGTESRASIQQGLGAAARWSGERERGEMEGEKIGAEHLLWPRLGIYIEQCLGSLREGSCAYWWAVPAFYFFAAMLRPWLIPTSVASR